MNLLKYPEPHGHSTSSLSGPRPPASFVAVGDIVEHIATFLPLESALNAATVDRSWRRAILWEEADEQISNALFYQDYEDRYLGARAVHGVFIMILICICLVLTLMPATTQHPYDALTASKVNIAVLVSLTVIGMLIHVTSFIRVIANWPSNLRLLSLLCTFSCCLLINYHYTVAAIADGPTITQDQCGNLASRLRTTMNEPYVLEVTNASQWISTPPSVSNSSSTRPLADWHYILQKRRRSGKHGKHISTTTTISSGKSFYHRVNVSHLSSHQIVAPIIAIVGPLELPLTIEVSHHFAHTGVHLVLTSSSWGRRSNTLPSEAFITVVCRNSSYIQSIRIFPTARIKLNGNFLPASAVLSPSGVSTHSDNRYISFGQTATAISALTHQTRTPDGYVYAAARASAIHVHPPRWADDPDSTTSSTICFNRINMDSNADPLTAGGYLISRPSLWFRSNIEAEHYWDRSIYYGYVPLLHSVGLPPLGFIHGRLAILYLIVLAMLGANIVSEHWLLSVNGKRLAKRSDFEKAESERDSFVTLHPREGSKPSRRRTPWYSGD